MKVINARAVKVTRHVHVICCSKPVSSSRFWLPAAHMMSEKTETRRGRGRVHCRPASNAEPLPPTSERRTEEVAALAGPASAPGPRGSVAPSSPRRCQEGAEQGVWLARGVRGTGETEAELATIVCP